MFVEQLSYEGIREKIRKVKPGTKVTLEIYSYTKQPTEITPFPIAKSFAKLQAKVVS